MKTSSTAAAPASSFRGGQTSPGAGSLLGMGACYALGTFTDNFYKQAAILLAAATGMTGMQSTATVLFSLPFILFSAWAGASPTGWPKKSSSLP